MPMREALVRVRPDRKGHGLLLMAAVWVLIGLDVSDSPRYDGAWHFLIPDLVAAAAWVGTAALAVLATWAKGLRPWAVAGMVIMPGIRCVSYLTAWLVALLPGGDPGFPRGWVFALSQVVMVAFVFYIATDSKDTTVADLNHVLRSNGGAQ